MRRAHALPPPLFAGSSQLALIAAEDLHSPYAKCFSQLIVELGGDCSVTVTPMATSGVQLPTLWAPLGAQLYADYAAW